MKYSEIGTRAYIQYFDNQECTTLQMPQLECPRSWQIITESGRKDAPQCKIN